HPYSSLDSAKNKPIFRRRKVWHHAFEQHIFSAQEISSVKTPLRREIYVACLEAHVDVLHAQLIDNQLYLVDLESLDSLRGLNCKIAKSIVASLQHDVAQICIKLVVTDRSI
ncbi:hypothetical protein OF83DRAFT_1045738, partial [Amylostereum chailletii]